MSFDKPLLKKQYYPINQELYDYLEKYKRLTKTNVFYEDLLRFQGSVVVYDTKGKDTLWIRVYYNEYEKKEIDFSLKKIYTLLHSDGDESKIQFLNVDHIDFCTFGNSKPFRVKVRNILNDNYTHFYVKKADASRIFGLELEDIISPNRINYLVFKDTLIEEHIVGIPGDIFIKQHLATCSESEKAQIAKEFVKFNERCMVGLLGDMRSYNFVIIPIYDYDHLVFKIRAIDFDQQCYEGNFKLYKPHLFKENFHFSKLVSNKLEANSIEQYQNEERSIMVKRMVGSEERLNDLLQAMKSMELSTSEKLEQLKTEIYQFTYDIQFKKATSMGEVIESALEFLKRNYKVNF
ncbi:hypothetical protein [Flavobacterium columnare]|uniref:Uncharacterized protein n=1 Tax=Flavobacterium columnare TaxID=996 RepID=A0AAI8CGV1_9FLAO|nr:hypothetical protein [Flavobacterium columnare]AMO20465.1 hypothetical protein UN65_09065 [Flavobacterium columnare]AUX18430.1 hypothetical protein AQ623_09210 [Flavobacterium columnare]MEB3801399.1 hypothetical protein [Flavobacterium columnare]QOG57513.1 hypothetical protein HUE29_09140 [Flavobacterium columnare]QOG60237.1 hypothetical protein HUE30_09140 [Flavobacterium columnare]